MNEGLVNSGWKTPHVGKEVQFDLAAHQWMTKCGK